jgi:hypothetical protein
MLMGSIKARFSRNTMRYQKKENCPSISGGNDMIIALSLPVLESPQSNPFELAGSLRVRAAWESFSTPGGRTLDRFLAQSVDLLS